MKPGIPRHTASKHFYRSMFHPRKIEKIGLQGGLKLYSINKDPRHFDDGIFRDRLGQVLQEKRLVADKLAGFAIFHEGPAKYMVLVHWQNENEMITSVSVLLGGQWVEDPDRYSFCLWDLEVFWHERNSYIRHMYSGSQDLAAYLADFLVQPC